MKRVHVIILVMLATAIGLFAISSDEVSTYGTFAQAEESGNTVKIVGTLVKEKELHYDPMKDPNYFTFYMKDSDGEVNKVVLHEARPKDFEMSEQIVLTGAMKNGDFIADSMLVKCPSKYKDEEVYVKSKQKTKD